MPSIDNLFLLFTLVDIPHVFLYAISIPANFSFFIVIDLLSDLKVIAFILHIQNTNEGHINVTNSILNQSPYTI